MHTKRVLQPGFSLMEIMIAIAIIGLMAVMVGPSLVKYLGRAKESKTVATLAALKQAMQDYQQDIGHFPTKSEGGLKALVQRPKAEKVRKKWDGPYLEGEDEVPEDAWNFEFEYNMPPTRHKGKYKYYEIISFGENNEEGGKEFHAGA